MDNGTEECVCSDLQTEDYSPLYAWYNYILIIIALPSLSVFGVCTNIINVFIYSRKRMLNSANTYLLFLACSDFLVILTGLFIFWIDSARSYIPELARAPYTTVYTLPFGYMAQTCSIYFTVAAALDCFISVCWRRATPSYCTVRRARQICGGIALCSVFYNSLRFPQFNLRKCFHDASQEVIIEICPTPLFYAVNMVYNVYMYMVLMTLLPFLFLLILNAFIVCRQSINLKKKKERDCPEASRVSFSTNTVVTMSGPSEVAVLESRRANGMEKGEKREEAADSASEGGDDTITMIMVVVLFLACNTLALIVNVIETFFEPDPLLLNLLSDASNFLVIFNSSVNCLIYFVFNKEYRRIFLHHASRIGTLMKHECGGGWCGCCCCRRSRPRLLYQPVPMNNNHRHFGEIARAAKAKAISAARHGSTSPASPVWQPLTTRRMVGLAWPNDYDDQPEGMNGGREEDDEADSGWGDGLSSRDNPSRAGGGGHGFGGIPSRFIAEVEIVDRDAARPHILVKALGERDAISITAL